MNFNKVDFGMIDTSGKVIRESDVVSWKSDGESVVCQVRWNPYNFAFNLIELNGSDPVCEQTAIRRQGSYVRMGSEEDYPGIVDKWLRLKGMNFGFLKEGEPHICFPLAAINTCIGYGMEKAFLNFRLLDKMVIAGGCREWGGCVNEQAALNAIQKEIDVEFVLADDMDDVLEQGGILSLKTNGGVHACAVFIMDGDPYLVNSNLGEGEFVRPLMSLDEIPRSEDPDYHRDYILVRN